MDNAVVMPENLYNALIGFAGEKNASTAACSFIKPYLIYRDLEFEGSNDFSYQNEGCQKNNFDYFKYYNWKVFLVLKDLIMQWNPNHEHYDSLEAACHEFLTYYRSEAHQNFPDEYLHRMEEIVSAKLGLLN